MKRYPLKPPRLYSIFGMLQWNPLDTLMSMWNTNKNVGAVKDTNQFNLQATRETNESNERMIRETNQQNLQLQHETWKREDNAIQRRMADLSAGGLNPILAAGGAAQASGPISLQAPQHQAPRNQPADRYAVRAMETQVLEHILRMRDDFATSRMQRELLRANTREHDARADQIALDTSFDRDSYQVRLNQVKENLRNTGERNTLLELQKEHQEFVNKAMPDVNHGIALENIRREVENEYREAGIQAGLDKDQLEIVSMAIANELAEHESEIYRDLGVTSSGSVMEKGVQAIRHFARGAFDAITDVASDIADFSGGIIQNIRGFFGGRNRR